MELVFFEKICNNFNLGILENTPVSLTGGFMHKIYSLFTTKGKYTVKILNSHVMKRVTAMNNYNTAEQLELILENHNIPIVPALMFNGKKMQSIDGQFFYLFDWYDGKTLKDKEINEYHCKEIGKILAKIHNIDIKKVAYERSEIHVDWESYVEQMKIENETLYKLLKENSILLYDTQEKGNKAIKILPAIISICHNDMDSKNVLWQANDYHIIDLECLSYSSPFLELYELALCWSGYKTGNIDFNLFKSFMQSYFDYGRIEFTDWEVIHDSNYNQLEWLEYNIKRVLGIDCDADEKEIGISEVRNTVLNIVYYHKIKESVLDIFTSIVKGKI